MTYTFFYYYLLTQSILIKWIGFNITINLFIPHGTDNMHKFTKCHCMSRSTCFSRTADDVLQNRIRNTSIVLFIYLLPAYSFFYCHIFDKTNHLQVLHPLYSILRTWKNKLTCYFYSLFTFVHRQVTIYRKLLGIFLLLSQGTNLHHHKKLLDSFLMTCRLHKYHKHPTLYLVLI